MSMLTVYPENKPNETVAKTTDYKAITEGLGQIGIRFERWQTDQALNYEALSQEEVLSAYRKSVDRIMTEHGFKSVDVVSMKPDHPDRNMFRQKFLAEHRHTEDEVRFFVDGSGLFYLHVEDKVYVVLCEKGDFIGIPANTRHWFDMGPAPKFTAIRLFTNPEGWVANFTGDKIADTFPKYGD